MDRNVIISALGLSADATDAQIEAALKTSKQNSDLHLSAQASAESTLTATIDKEVNAALAQKKIKAESVAFWKGSLKADFAGGKAQLDAMTPIPKLSAEIVGTTTPEIEARAGWSYDKWMQDDPKGLEALAENDPTQFNKLFNKK